MNLSGFKKVHEDEHKAVLRNGAHSITIAKKALSPKHLEGLKKLPLYAADGSNTDPEAPAETPQQPAPGVNIYVGGQAPQPAPVQQAPIAPAPQPQPAPAPAPQPAPSEPPAPTPLAPQNGLAPAPQPQASPDQPAPKEPPSLHEDQATAPAATENPAIAGATAGTYGGSPAQNAQQYVFDSMKESQAFSNDLHSGDITPKTYGEIANKHTFGKIGTMFGLLLSGAASGLTGQPDALLGMMKNEIDNDLQAQMKSRENTQNLLRINQQHQYQMMQLPKLLAEGKLTEEEAKAMTAEANMKAFAMARAQYNWMAFHDLVQNTQKLPVGSPARMQAEQALGMMYQAINNENYDIFSRAAAAGALGTAFGGGSGGGQGGESGFQRRTGMLRMSGNEKLAEDLEGKHLPGFEGRASKSIPQDIQAELIAKKEYDQAARKYLEFAEKHASNWKNLNMKDRLAIAREGAVLGAELQGKYRMKTHGGVYKEGEQHFIESIIPTNAASWQASFNQLPKVKQTISNNEADTNNLLKGYGMPAVKWTPGHAGGGHKKEPAKTEQKGPKDGDTGTFEGKPVIWHDGKWNYKK